MKITAFNGSPWGQQSHTHVMTSEFLAGAAQAGAKVQNILLVKERIIACDKCGTCFYKTPGECRLKDDMKGLLGKFMASDIVVFVTPVYMDNVTPLMKIFIDRLLPLLEPHYEKDLQGQYRRGKRFKKYPVFVVISSSALPQQTNFQVLKLFFRRLARTMHTELAAEIYRDVAGVILLNANEIQFGPSVNKYLQLLRDTGKEFVNTGMIGPETAEELRKPIVDFEDYVEYANKKWDQMLAKHGSAVLS